MTLSHPARLMAGLTLITVPTIVYGGLTLLQQALFRAGHAHAGVLVILSLVLQVLLDSATLPERVRWGARVLAVAGAILVSGGFFGLAFFPGFATVLWLGAASVSTAVLLAGIGLVRRPA